MRDISRDISLDRWADRAGGGEGKFRVSDDDVDDDDNDDVDDNDNDEATIGFEES